MREKSWWFTPTVKAGISMPALDISGVCRKFAAVRECGSVLSGSWSPT